MGCDIHAYLEAKPKGNKDYTLSEEQDLARDYGIFGFLAHVRCNVPEPYEPKGLPNGMADFTKREYEIWEGDAHSMSYLYLDELRDAFQRHSKHFKERDKLGDDYLSLIPKMEHYEADGYDCRLVFWFDN